MYVAALMPLAGGLAVLLRDARPGAARRTAAAAAAAAPAPT
jgi:hypothetical protein